MNPRLLASVMMVALVAMGAADAWALNVTTSLATSLTTPGSSSVSHTVVVENDDPTGAPPRTVTFEVGDTDFLVPTGNVFGHYVADAEFLTGSGSVALAGFVDTTNSLFGTEILIGTADESTAPFFGPFVPLTLSGLYALTLTATATLDPGDTLSFTHTVSVVAEIPAVPEPASAVLLVAGLIVVGTMRRCCRRACSLPLSPDR
jgi:plastocyanin